jgi:cytochrome c peroxidase
LRYTQAIPPFTEHYFDDEGDDSIDQGPAGGRTWDGRAQSTHEQAQLPLFSPFEMANRGPDDVVAKVERAPYAAQVRQAFGEGVFKDKSLAFKGILMSLETFQQSPEDFYPYSSKYDAYLRGRTALTQEEARGLAAFNDVNKGNCARCHPSAMRHGAFPQFTDFGFAAVGAPRNRAIPANADNRYYDLGLWDRCAPILRRALSIAACFARPRCAMSRPAGYSSTTGFSTGWRMSCGSTRSATLSRKSGFHAPRTALF